MERLARYAWDCYTSTIWDAQTTWRGNPYRDEWQAEYLRRYVVAKRQCAAMLNGHA